MTGLSLRRLGSVGGLDHLLVRAIGWPATVLHGDPCVFDRWRWVCRRLAPGPYARLTLGGCGPGAFTMYAARVGWAVTLSLRTEVMDRLLTDLAGYPYCDLAVMAVGPE